MSLCTYMCAYIRACICVHMYMYVCACTRTHVNVYGSNLLVYAPCSWTDLTVAGKPAATLSQCIIKRSLVVKNGTASCWSVATVAVAPNRWFGNTSVEELALLGLLRTVLLILFSLGKPLA